MGLPRFCKGGGISEVDFPPEEDDSSSGNNKDFISKEDLPPKRQDS